MSADLKRIAGLVRASLDALHVMPVADREALIANAKSREQFPLFHQVMDRVLTQAAADYEDMKRRHEEIKLAELLAAAQARGAVLRIIH